MASHATAIHGVSAPRVSVRLERPRVTAAYMLPTLTTGAGCWLALAVAARLLGALMTSPPTH